MGCRQIEVTLWEERVNKCQASLSSLPLDTAEAPYNPNPPGTISVGNLMVLWQVSPQGTQQVGKGGEQIGLRGQWACPLLMLSPQQARGASSTQLSVVRLGSCTVPCGFPTRHPHLCKESLLSFSSWKEPQK